MRMRLPARLTVLLDAKGGPAPQEQPKGPGDPGENIRAQVLKMNSDAYGKPLAQFKKGHVSARTGPKAKVGKTGFVVQLPSGAPIVTPAVYDGLRAGRLRVQHRVVHRVRRGRPDRQAALVVVAGRSADQLADHRGRQ